MIDVYIGISHRFDCIKGMTERSILRNTKYKVNIHHLYPIVESGVTGFTNVRYTIRKGIYLDCDMIVLGDIAELWEYHRVGKFVCMEDGSTEVSVIDCVHDCTKKREEKRLPKKPIIPLEWNIEDCHYKGKLPKATKLFHFTSLNTQPWFYNHPNPEAVDLYKEYA